ncbi:hypothetical protein FSP39_015931 [Pinctada imbricata]|uniref:Major facilitator superfamily (MFS) profile domain-containing protein n=1 Tax=Pinctada imbricata TaxID=66713 RepID=A0AA88YET0_PINIB|nr:hypothetical protein FSP39_015931 [Pinctada imbricata]
MCLPKRYIVVLLGFWGLLISIGYRAVFAMVMVHVIKASHGTDNDESLFAGNCTAFGHGRNLTLDWSVAISQYFNTGYFLGSVITQLPGGYLASRFSPRRVCGFSILISSVMMVCLPEAIKYSKYLVFVLRCLQGIVEGCSVPALNGVISAWAPKYERSKMITFAFAGKYVFLSYLSPAVGQIVTGFTACFLAWYASLYIYGGLGIIWSLLWIFCLYDTPSQHPSLSRAERDLFEREGASVKQGSAKVASQIPWRKILTSLPMSAIMIGSFCRNWIFAMVITEVPQYFKDAFKMDIATIGLKAALPEILMTVVTITGGVTIDKLIKSRLISTTVGRKLAQTTGFGIEALCFLSLRWIYNSTNALVLLSVGVAFSGFAISGYQVNPLDLAPQYASVLTGMSRLGAIGAVLSTFVAGKLGKQNIESWQEIFTIAGSIHLVGVAYYAIFASGQLQDWAVVEETKPLVSSVRESSPPENAKDNEDQVESIEDRDFRFSASQRAHNKEEYDSPDWFTTSYP